MGDENASFASKLQDQLHTGSPVWLRVGRLFTGREKSAQAEGHVVFDQMNILYAGVAAPDAALVRPEQTEPDFDLPNYTALPGLTDAHTHLFLEGGETDTEVRSAYLKRPPEEMLQEASSRLKRLVAMGITAVREAGDKVGVGLTLQARYRSASRGVMPYVDSPGAAINHQKRYGSFMARPMEEQGTPDAAVADRVAAGSHRIKLLATGIINFAKGAVTAKPQMHADELTAFVAAARKVGQQTMVHCSGNDGVANCLAAQVDTIEHGYFIDRSQLGGIRDLDMVWVPTIAPVAFQFQHPEHIGWSDEVCDNLKRIVEDHQTHLAYASEMGVRIVAGSDAGSHGVAHGWGFLRELELMQDAGLPASEVLHYATGAGVDHMGYAERFGVLEAGALARLILTDKPVLDSVTHLRSEKVVIYDGHTFSDHEPESVPGL